MLGGCRFHFSLCVPHDGFIAFIFSGAFTAPTNQVVCLDKIECLRLDRTSACVTEFTAFWMTKWVGSNNIRRKKAVYIVEFYVIRNTIPVRICFIWTGSKRLLICQFASS